MAKYRCKCCDVIIESKFRHDFQKCPGKGGKPCPNKTFVDGGNDYSRAGGKDLTLIEFVEEEE